MSTKKMGSGWLKISSPEDLQKALTRMLNKILMSEDPVMHAGRFASLANAWTNAHRLFLEEEEINAIKQRLDAIERNKGPWPKFRSMLRGYILRNLSNLERRIALLEGTQSGIDTLVLAMETLDDTELGILQEYMSLLKAGFSPDEVSDMMGEESYQQALAITDKVEAELRFRQYSEPEYKTVKKEMGRPRKDKAGARDACQDGMISIVRSKISRKDALLYRNDDLKRLARLMGESAKSQADLAILKAARTPPSFRKFYGFDVWCDALATVHNTNLFMI